MLDRFMNEKRTAFNNLGKGGLMKDEIESNFFINSENRRMAILATNRLDFVLIFLLLF